MRLKTYIVERTSIYGAGITFLDIDETILRTHARVAIKKDGKVIKRLRNFEYLQYKPEEGEEVDFSEYSDAKLFHRTSEPIETTIKRMQKMMHGIKKSDSGSKMVIVSARANLNDKEEFLQTFRDFGIPIDDIYIERVGEAGAAGVNIPEKKKNVMFKYLLSGNYRRARLIDDSKANCRAFLELENELPDDLITSMRERYKIPIDEPVIDFYALNVTKEGSLKRIVG